MRTLILLAALIGGCTDDTEAVIDDTDLEDSDTDAPDVGQAYTVTGYVASVPYGTDDDGEPPWLVLLNPVVGSLVAPDNGHTYVQCLTYECGELRPITLVELLCRVGDQADPFGREICQLVEVIP